MNLSILIPVDPSECRCIYPKDVDLEMENKFLFLLPFSVSSWFSLFSNHTLQTARELLRINLQLLASLSSQSGSHLPRGDNLGAMSHRKRGGGRGVVLAR